MNPLVVVDCQKVITNPFALTHAIADRSRALRRGSEARVDANDCSPAATAINEIAERRLGADELAPYLDWPYGMVTPRIGGAHRHPGPALLDGSIH